MMLTPEQPPVALKNVAVKTEGRTVHVSWTSPDATPRPVLVRETNSSAVGKLVGQVVPATEVNSILGNGRTYANTTSLAQQCQFDIPPNTSLALAVVIISGAKGIISELIRVSSVEKCEIDKAETRMEGSRLKIILKSRPKNLSRIHYMVARKAGSEAPWASVEDAVRNTLTAMTVQEYARDGMILMETPPKDELYISVIGEYKMPDGSVVYSEPSRMKVSNRPKIRIKYHLSWGRSGWLGLRRAPKDCKLHVAADAQETPALKLVYRSDGHIPMKLLDPKTVVLHTVPESDTGFPAGQYVYEFPDSTWERVGPQTELRLMLSENDMAEYEVVPEDVASLKVPWK